MFVKPNNEEIKKSQIDWHNPFHWWGLVVLFIGITTGGAIGGLIGAACYYAVFQVSKKNYSTTKKVIISSLITIAAVIAYVVLATVFFSLIKSK